MFLLDLIYSMFPYSPSLYEGLGDEDLLPEYRNSDLQRLAGQRKPFERRGNEY